MICLLFFFNHMLIDAHLIKKRCRTYQELIFCFSLLFYLQQDTAPSTNQLNNDVKDSHLDYRRHKLFILKQRCRTYWQLVFCF